MVATLNEVKIWLEREGHAPVSKIIRTPSVKTWHHTGFCVSCPECGLQTEYAALFVTTDEDRTLVEAMTLWPDAEVVYPPEGM